MFDKIYNILVQFLGESKQGSYDSSVVQYQFNCPQCADENGGVPDGKYNLEVNLKLQKFQCWRCAESDGTKGSIGFLIKRFGSKKLYFEYKEEIDSLRKHALYTLDCLEDAPIDNYETFITLPKTFSKIVLKTCTNKTLIDYLNKRKITQDIIDRHCIGYTKWEYENPRWSNRLIIPSFDQYGDLNYWVGRDFTGKAFQKYCNCDGDKKSIVFQESLLDFDAPIYLVEGAIDCIYFPNSLSLLGKSLCKESAIYKLLISKANNEVVVCLDGDTNEYETKKIYKLLDVGRLRGKVRYIQLGNEETPYKDFGEAYELDGKKGIIKLIKNKKKYKEFDLL